MDSHTETQTLDARAKPFTVISGGKSQNPGETHESRATRGAIGMAQTDKCKKGLLFVFDQDSRMENCPGIGAIDSRCIPDEIILLILSIAQTAAEINSRKE
jgi:hypothetical protein